MNSVFFLVLRRMRAPLIVLIAIYAISVLGLTLVPGVDAGGQPAPPLSIFHAFYFISYTATTIGFGEIPGSFSDAQRLWVIVCIYLTVIGWSYSIVTLLALFQDKAFQSFLVVARFSRRVRNMHEPFYLVCGCGETGAMVCHALDELDVRFVVVELRDERVQELDLEDFKTDVPTLAADAREPSVLALAGLRHAQCRGVLALTHDDEANLAIAIAARLLNPALPALARADSPMTEANMASFGTRRIINPYARFADYLGLAVEAPHVMRLIELLTSLPGQPMPPLRHPPEGAWIVCGHGRFGKPVVDRLQERRLEVTVIDPGEQKAAVPGAPQHVSGLGTEAETLLAAGVDHAAGLVAGTDNDVNNLSIAMTARDLRPDLFVVMRQNRVANAPLFEAFAAEFTMVPGRIVAHEALAAINTPLLARFLAIVRGHSDAWARATADRFAAVFGETVPYLWRIAINPAEAPALATVCARAPVTLTVLVRDFRDRNASLALLPLLLVREGKELVLPDPATVLQAEDELLLAGDADARNGLRTTLANLHALEYVISGIDRPGGLVWQWLAGRRL